MDMDMMEEMDGMGYDQEGKLKPLLFNFIILICFLFQT